MDSNLKITQNRSFTTIINTNKANYNIYKYQILDTGSNTHIINHYEGLTNVRKTLESSVFNKRRDIYRIKAYKDAKINLIILDGLSTITLLNVAYVSSYLINIIIIKRLSRGGIYQLNSTFNIYLFIYSYFTSICGLI